MLLAPVVLWVGALGMGRQAEAVTPSPGYRLGQNFPFAVKPQLLKFRAPSAAAAVSAPQSGDVALEFDTIKDVTPVAPERDYTLNPPDGALAAGPSYLVSAANSVLQVRRLTGQLVYQETMEKFFGVDPAANVQFAHPRVSYDQLSKRFFILINAMQVFTEPFTGTGQQVEVTGAILMVSVDSDPFHGWRVSLLQTSRGDMWPGVPMSVGPSPVDPASLPADPNKLPTERSEMTALGYDKSAIYLSFDMYLIKTHTFCGNQTLIIDKAAAMNGIQFTPKVIHDIFVPRPGPLVGFPSPLDLYAHGLKPAEGATTAAPGLIMNYHPTAGLVLYKVSNALTAPVVENAILNGTPYPPAPPAPQNGVITLLPTGGTGLGKVTFRNNRLYTAHTVGNALDASLGLAQIKWYVIDPAANVVSKQGTIADPTQSFFHPSFVPDNFGKAVLVFHASGPQSYPSIQHAWFDLASGAMSPFQVTEASTLPYDWRDGNHQSAWGNYTDASTDVVSQTQVWVQGQLVSAEVPTEWRLRAAKIVATPPPAAPSELKAQALSSEEVKLTWRDNSVNEQGFRIERKLGSGPSVTIGTAAANTTSFNDKGVLGGNTYTYRIRAYIGGAYSDYSNTATVTTPLPPPAAPSELTVAATSVSVAHLVWKDNTGYEQGFKIERKLGTGAYAQVGTVGANVVEFDSTGLTAGSAYTFRVRAYNTTGNSGYSNEAALTMPVAPIAPSSLTATVKPVGTIALVWADRSANEDGFRIERKSGTSAYAEIKVLAANATTYTDAPDPGATYTYRVRAYKGVASSSYTNTASAALPAAPAAPSNLQATMVNGRVKLTWTDNANNELGFKVERRYMYDYMAPPQVIASLGANVTTYTDPTVLQRGFYTYRVRAWNNGAYSAYADVFVNVQ